MSKPLGEIQVLFYHTSGERSRQECHLLQEGLNRRLEQKNVRLRGTFQNQLGFKWIPQMVLENQDRGKDQARISKPLEVCLSHLCR